MKLHNTYLHNSCANRSPVVFSSPMKRQTYCERVRKVLSSLMLLFFVLPCEHANAVNVEVPLSDAGAACRNYMIAAGLNGVDDLQLRSTILQTLAVDYPIIYSPRFNDIAKREVEALRAGPSLSKVEQIAKSKEYFKEKADLAAQGIWKQFFSDFVIDYRKNCYSYYPSIPQEHFQSIENIIQVFQNSERLKRVTIGLLKDVLLETDTWYNISRFSQESKKKRAVSELKGTAEPLDIKSADLTEIASYASREIIDYTNLDAYFESISLDHSPKTHDEILNFDKKFATGMHQLTVKAIVEFEAYKNNEIWLSFSRETKAWVENRNRTDRDKINFANAIHSIQNYVVTKTEILKKHKLTMAIAEHVSTQLNSLMKTSLAEPFPSSNSAVRALILKDKTAVNDSLEQLHGQLGAMSRSADRWLEDFATASEIFREMEVDLTAYQAHPAVTDLFKVLYQRLLALESILEIQGISK